MSCHLAVLSLQDSPDASREPMAKLSVSCVRAHGAVTLGLGGGAGALPDTCVPTEQAHLGQPARDQPLQLCQRRGR